MNRREGWFGGWTILYWAWCMDFPGRRSVCSLRAHFSAFWSPVHPWRAPGASGFQSAVMDDDGV
jgi:hypothetical protein